MSYSAECLLSFPEGPFRFFALDVETANNHRGSICQIGVACVRADGTIETWVTLVDPETDIWIWSGLHGITPEMVQGAPTFAEVLAVLEAVLVESTIYQHSGFDRSAIAAACADAGRAAPSWSWRDSVQVARAAWPELKGNGGHGLASLKAHLGLVFHHHDAGEDARAAAEVVLRAERVGVAAPNPVAPKPITGSPIDAAPSPARPQTTRPPAGPAMAARHVGMAQITQGNLNHNHIYLRTFIDKFPADAIGRSNSTGAAIREIHVDWGGDAIVQTDIDGAKKIFRKRSWIRTFFEKNGARAGDWVTVAETAPYYYRIALHRDEQDDGAE